MIFLFSGTGNSRLVARALASRLPERDGSRLVEIGRDNPPEFTLYDGECTVWVFPVYSWGVPPVVRRFMRSVSLGCAGAPGRHFMVCTCGDDCGLTYRMWRREVRRRGWRAAGGWSVEMPNTYVSLPGFDVDPVAVAARKLAQAPARIDEVARAVGVGSSVDDTVRGSFPWLKTRVIYPMFTRWLMSPRPFRATDACVGCGRCAAACPMKNIAMTDDRPHWGKDCAGCLGCYHACPQHAIAYGRRTASKGRYRAPASLPAKG